ncbi:MAG: cytochrome c oxidase subunit 3 [Betaproteobacteria bacterium]|nr:cytochrome c oxidase subunit 3 [Betaproteobacteria bacterium]
MSIFQELTAKSWATDQGKVDDLYAGRASSGLAKKLALRVFLAVVTVLFMLLVIAYGGRMAYEDWRPAPQVSLLWANTLVLILSSVALQWAQYSVRRGRMDAMRAGLLAGGAFTVVFLFGQVLAWRQLGAMVYFEVSNPAIAFFYLITGLHGLHLLGGLVAWGRTVVKVWGNFDVAKVRQSVELCTVYWHFLLLVWLVLFGLLFTGNNLDILLKLCGIR